MPDAVAELVPSKHALAGEAGLDQRPLLGIWFRNLRLLPDEHLVWQVACNWQQRGVARGGRLGLTSQALIFEPNRLDGLMGGKSRRLPLAEVASVGIESGGIPKSSVSGGMRRRMRLDLANGQRELLLMSDLGTRVRDVEAAIARAP